MNLLIATAESKVGENARPGTAMNPVGWTWQRWHLWLLIAGLLIRVVFCLITDKEAALAEVDGREYHAYAQSLLALKWDDYPRYFNCIRPPFYPLFLVPFVALSDQVVWHIQLAQAVIGVLLAIILAKVAGRWAGQRAGDWAFIIALFHPFLIFYSAFLLTEILFITLLWSGIACLQRLDELSSPTQMRWLTWSAVALALACLTRPALQLFLIVAVLWIGLVTWRQYGWSTALKRAIQFTLIVSVLLLPWMIGNLRAHGELSLAPGAFELNYALSNSPEYLRMYEAKTKEEYYQHFKPLLERFFVESGTTPEQWMEEARAFRRERPGDWLRLQWYKFKHFWRPWLNPLIFPTRQYLISVLSATPLFLLAAMELWRRRTLRNPFLVLMLGLVGIGYLVGGLLIHTQVRYRIPFVDVAFIILTASFLGQLSLKKVSELKLVKLLRPATQL